MLPENSEYVESERGTIISNDGEYFPASFLANLKSDKLPNSRAGIYKAAERLGWPCIKVPGKGAKDGVRYFLVPKEYLEAAAASILNTPYKAKKQHDISIVSESGAHQYIELKNSPDTIYIESYPEVRGAAGVGQVTPTDQVIVKMAVNAADWRNYVGLDHRHIKLIAVHGDSMKPTLSHGDQVLVDTACHNFVDDAIYAIQQGDLTRFKRIKLRLDGSIEVKSDNEKEGFKLETYSATEAAEFQLIGRVIPFKFGRFDS